MERTPIAVLTKDNPEYLNITLRSLKATETFESPVFIIDDCSEYQKTKDFLYSDQPIEVCLDDWTSVKSNSLQELADKEAAKSYLTIPQITSMNGLKNRYNIIKTKKYLGKLNRILFAVKFVFDSYPSSKMCAILDDDIMLNKNWLREAYKIYEYEHFKSKIGMISVFNEKCKDEEDVEYYINDVINGKCVLFTKKLFDEIVRTGIYNGVSISGEGPAYYKIQKLAENLGFVSLNSRLSYVQSLEKRNLVNKEKVLMYDSNFVKPIAWSEEISQ